MTFREWWSLLWEPIVRLPEPPVEPESATDDGGVTRVPRATPPS